MISPEGQAEIAATSWRRRQPDDTDLEEVKRLTDELRVRLPSEDGKQKKDSEIVNSIRGESALEFAINCSSVVNLL